MNSIVHTEFMPLQHQFAYPLPFKVHSPVYTTSASVSAPPEELRCKYVSKRCENPRTNKKSGGLHKFCAVHREKANRNQMRLDHRRRMLKRMQRGECPHNRSKVEHEYKQNNDDERDAKSKNEWHDFMPFVLHSRERIFSSATITRVKPTLDPQDLYILEELLFSDEDDSDEDRIFAQMRCSKRRFKAKNGAPWHSLSLIV